MPAKTANTKDTGKTKPGLKKSVKVEVPPDPMHDGSREPDDALLRSMLGKTMDLWKDLRSRMAGTYPTIREEWKFYGRKYGWNMKMIHGKRNLFFFVPREGGFMVGFTFGEKATEEVMRSRLSERLKKELSESRKYAEGRGLRVDVRSAGDLGVVKELVEIKIRN
jgi:hypothetical protein